MALVTIARSLITIVNLNDGKKGDKGEAALTLVVTPNTFVFETDDKGAVLVGNKRATIALYEGTQRVTPDNVTLKMDGCNAEVVNKAILNFKTINPNTYSGYVQVTAIYKGEERTAIAEFYVSKQRWNDAKFTTIKGQFESIQEEFERVDGEITDTKSTFNQLPEKITLEVLRHENGINLIKGGSLEYPELLDLRNHPEYITINNYGNLCKKSITLKRGYVETDDHTVAYFPRQTLKANTDYTISCWVRSDGYLYISCPLRYTFDGPPIDWVQAAPPNTNGKYQHFEFTFNTGVNTFAHFYLSARRNVNATVTDLQLEEGKKATSWTNPDKDERFRRAGIDLELERIILQADKVYIRNSKGEQTAAIDQDGNLIAGTLRTKDNGGGYIYMHDNLQEYYKHGANHPSRRIGYIGNDWVDQRLSDDGNVIWEMNERGIVHYQTPERWVHVSDAYITTIEDIKKFFLINQGRTLYLIFNSSNHKSATLKEYVAARDVNGNIISSAGVTVEEGQANDGKLFYTSQYNEGLSLGDRFELDNNKFSSPFTGLILASKPTHYYPFNNQSGQTAIPPEYTKFRQLYGVEDYYYVDFNRPVEWAYVNIYHLGRRIGSHRMFRNK